MEVVHARSTGVQQELVAEAVDLAVGCWLVKADAVVDEDIAAVVVDSTAEAVVALLVEETEQVGEGASAVAGTQDEVDTVAPT